MKFIYLLISAAVLSGCNQNKDSSQIETDEPVRSVKYTKAIYQSHTQFRELTGIIRSAQTSPISFQVSGTVNNILVSKGHKVKQGQVLAQLETSDLLLALRKAQASVGAAKASRLQAEDKFQRSEKLNSKGFVSDSELNAIRADFDAKHQQEQLALTDLSNAELNLERAKLYAPFSGQISQVFIDDYTEINSGQKIIELVNDFAYEVDFLLPEALIQEVKFGEQIQIIVPALNDTVFIGQVSEIGAVVERGNAYAVTLLLSEPTAALRNGMSANIQLNIGNTSQDVVLLPLEAFNFNDKDAKNSELNSAIYVVDTDTKRLEKRYVSTKNNINSEVVVLNNLAEGEIVVIAGIPFLYEGQEVTLWEGL